MGKRARVLVVDDDAEVRGVLTRAIEREGLEPIPAEDGPSALTAFDARAPRLVLLDVQMPGMTGFEVCERLRRRPGGAEIPIVMMTGMDDMESIQRAYDVGATDFVTKPIPWLVLAHRLRYLLRSADNLLSLRQSEERLANAQRMASLGSWELDFETGRFDGSDALWEIVGVDPPRGKASIETLAAAIHPDDRERVMAAYRSCRERGVPVRYDHRILRPDGEERLLHCQIRIGHDAEGRPARLVGALQDLTDRRRTEEQVRFLSSHDPLTSLGNRRLFRERLDLAIRQARQGGWKVGVLYLDLDHFKRINETFGHSVGDSLLGEVAHRLVMGVRGADLGARSHSPLRDDHSSVSRFGGDEFTVLIPRLRDEQDLSGVARRLIDSLAEPFSLGGHEVIVSGSIGITVFPNDGEDPEELLRNADTAMYAAKEDGRSHYRFYTESMNERTLRRLILEGKLRRALEESQFQLYFQPKVCMADGRVTGFEGLVRWNDPELGVVGPGDFIPVAEETGLIVALGDWVMQAACRQAAAWACEAACHGDLAVNLSPHQFRRPGLAERIAEIVRESGVDAKRMQVEITEGVVLHDTEQVIRELEAIRALGMRVALDDFGTGYSSLSYLRRLPVDTLKIDRVFIRDIESDREDAALTRGIIAMGKGLGLGVVAEGVETEGQRALLAEWGCDEMQGFLFSPPVPAPAALELWRAHAPRKAGRG